MRLYTSYKVPVPELNRYDLREGDITVYLETCTATYGPCTEPELNSEHSFGLRKGQYGWHIVPVGRFVDATDPNQISGNEED